MLAAGRRAGRSGPARGPGGGRGGVGALGRHGEHVGAVVRGAAGEGDVGVLAVLGAGEHGQASVHGAALGGVVGDRVAEFGVFVVRVQELSVRPAALPGLGVGVQGAAHQQAFGGDRLDAEQVSVGQGPAGLAGLDVVVVAGQTMRSPALAVVPSAIVTPGPGLTRPRRSRSSRMRRDSSRRRVWSAAISSASRPGGEQGGVGSGCGVHHLLGVPAGDPGVLVVVGEHGGVAVAQPQRGGLFPGGAEPDGLGEADVAEAVGEQEHAAAVGHRLQLHGVSGDDDLAAVLLGEGDQVGEVGAGHHRRLVDDQQGSRGDGDGAARAAPAGEVAEELGAVVGGGDAGRPGCCGPTGTR